MSMTLEECATCPRYSAKEQRQRNRLYCVFCCEKHIEQASKIALKYNLSVSGEDFGIEAEYEHGNKVYGSGKENRQMMKWEAESKGYSCNDCYLSMQNCHDKNICCEDETGLCDYFEEIPTEGRTDG